MKLDFSFLETSKNRVTTVTTVTPADDAACIGNPSKNERVTRVTFSETPGQAVTQVTQVKKVGLPTETATDAEVTQVTQVTHKNIEVEKKNEVDRPEPMELLQPRGEVETCPAIVAPAMPETNATGGAVALHCSDDDKSLLADAGLLVDKLRPDASAELVKTINTLNEAEHAEDQESFDFALEVLRSVVDDARQLAPGETCGGVAYG